MIFIFLNYNLRTVETADLPKSNIILVGNGSLPQIYSSNYVLIDLLKHLSSHANLVNSKCFGHMNILKNSIDARKIWAIKGMYEPNNYLSLFSFL